MSWLIRIKWHPLYTAGVVMNFFTGEPRRFTTESEAYQYGKLSFNKTSARFTLEDRPVYGWTVEKEKKK